jgi:hypothetical protein
MHKGSRKNGWWRERYERIGTDGFFGHEMSSFPNYSEGPFPKLLSNQVVPDTLDIADRHRLDRPHVCKPFI